MKKSIKIIKPMWQAQGKGAKVLRIIGSQTSPRLDPFLMLDFASIKSPAGFPDHPHRGFQTVSYLVSGTALHQDFKGNQGELKAGDVQWMTAGRGIVHSEMPGPGKQASQGFQLWINLKSDQKMIEPRYQQFKAQNIPIVEKDNARVKIISGKWNGASGPIIAKSPVSYYDIVFEENGKFNIQINPKWNAFIFVYEGKIVYNENIISTHQACILSKEDQSKFSGNKAKFVLLAGQPLNEPVEQYGPFVMNTKQQIYEAIEDYQNQRNGFEGSRNWKSKIGQLSKKH